MGDIQFRNVACSATRGPFAPARFLKRSSGRVATASIIRGRSNLRPRTRVRGREGIVPRDQDLPKAAPTHSPGALLTGGLSSADRHSSCYAHARARARPKLERQAP